MEGSVLSPEFVAAVEDRLGDVDVQDEFEVSFDAARINLSLGRFNHLLKCLRKRSEGGLPLMMETTLDVAYTHDREAKRAYRITVQGDSIDAILSNVQQRENHVVFAILAGHVKEGRQGVSIMEKRREEVIDDAAAPLRFRRARESPVDAKALEDLHRLNMRHEEAQHVFFRHKQRMSLVVVDNKDITLRTDLTDVRSAKRASGLRAGRNAYELEVELTVKKPAKRLSSEHLRLFLKEVTYMMKLVQNTDVPLTAHGGRQVVEQLLALTGAPPNSKDLPGMQSQSAEVVHIVDTIPNRYSVTDKADGERHFLFVRDGAAYLVSNILEVKRLGPGDYDAKVAAAYHNTVLDGEYLFIGKHNRFMFLAFDILFHKGADVRGEASLSKRYELMMDVTTTVFRQKHTPKPLGGAFDFKKMVAHYRADITAYVQAMNAALAAKSAAKNVVVSKYFAFPTGANPAEVYACSTLIWNIYTMDPAAACPYKLDGLVYTPLDQKYTTVARETIHRTFKWKPSSKNSIDFYLTFEKNPDTQRFINVFDNAGTQKIEDLDKGDDAEEALRHQVKDKVYRIANLHVGRYEKQVGNETREIPVLFQADKNLHVANLYVDDETQSQVKDIEGNVIEDETVVEFAYNNDPAVDAPFRWVPLRTRMDKTYMVRKNRRKYGNNAAIADKIWLSIQDGIEIADLQLLGDEATHEDHMRVLRSKISADIISKTRREDRYYQEMTNLGEALRNYHNFIKSNLIYTYCALTYELSTDKGKSKRTRMDVLDIACGRGGDINKFYHARVNSYVGIDKSSGDIHAMSDGAISRYMHQKSVKPDFTPMKFMVADATVPLNYADQAKAVGQMTDKNKAMMIEIFGADGKATRHRTFDVINCQFAMHYFLANDQSWDNFCGNLKKFMRPGGYFLMTTFDGELLHKSFGAEGRITGTYTTEDGKKEEFFDIVRRYPADTKDIKRTGLMIDVKMAWIQSTAYLPEYLVDPGYVVDQLGKKAGLTLLDSARFGDVQEVYRAFFKDAASYESNEKTRGFLAKVGEIYNDGREIIRTSQKYSRLSRYYVFQKL
jgi:SAM-dependent methyltransferase